MAKKKIIIPILIAAIFVLSGVTVGVITALKEYGTVKYTVDDTLPDGEGKTVRVVLLGGQSNASGCSRDEYLKKNVSAEKYEEYQKGYDNVYINYMSGLKTSGGFVKTATLQGEMDGCFGPELGMAEKLSQMYPNETIFIIKCAWGGTDLFEQWLSPSSKGKTGKLYKHFIGFVLSSLEYLEDKNYDPKIEVMCWMQGESDSFSVENATNYEKHLANFIRDTRAKFRSYASEDGIAFVDAYIADNPVYWVFCEHVNNSKRAVASSSEMNVLIDTISEGLTCEAEPEEAPDLAHYDSMSEIKLGKLFAEAAANFFD